VPALLRNPSSKRDFIPQFDCYRTDTASQFAKLANVREDASGQSAVCQVLAGLVRAGGDKFG
jgi:hypothetical protein